MKARKPSALPPSLPPRLVPLDAAADYIGISSGKFNELVKDGRAPQPRRIDRRKAWDVRELDRFVDSLPRDGGGANDATWDD